MLNYTALQGVEQGSNPCSNKRHFVSLVCSERHHFRGFLRHFHVKLLNSLDDIRSYDNVYDNAYDIIHDIMNDFILCMYYVHDEHYVCIVIAHNEFVCKSMIYCATYTDHFQIILYKFCMKDVIIYFLWMNFEK
jgi:hypothetical protein